MSGGIGTASAGEQNVHGIDKQSIRSVASTRGQQVRGVDKQVGFSASAIKWGVHNMREQTTGPRHRQASGRTVVSVNEQAGLRRKKARQVHGVSVGK